MEIEVTVGTMEVEIEIPIPPPVVVSIEPIVIERVPSNYGLITFTAAIPNAAEIKVS